MAAIEPLRVGLPRALLHYWFAPAWQVFLSSLGAMPIVSPPTNKALLSLGLQIALDEVCLPVKLFLGHAAYLSRDCDVLLVPHIISVEQRAFTCPKFMGLPDLVRQALPGSRMVAPKVNVKAGAFWHGSARMLAEDLGYRGRDVARAWRLADAAQKRYEADLHSGRALALPPLPASGPVLAVLGHPYCLYDSFLNMDLLARVLKSGIRAATPELLPEAAIKEGLTHLSKEVFWSFGRRQLGTLHYLLAHERCLGVIHTTAFACGPESLIGEMIARAVARRHIPLLRLHLDEHTGEAGFLTRLEAFLDMLARWHR